MTAVPAALRGGINVRLSTTWQLLLLAAGTAVLYLLFRDTWTLPHHDDASLFKALNGVRDWVDANRTISPVFLYLCGPLRTGIDALSEALTTGFGLLSWVGLLAILMALGLALVTWRTAVLVAVCLAVIGLFGLWTEMVQTLVLILAAVAI